MRILKIFERIMTVVLVVALITVLVTSYLPQMFGYTPYAVTSGSMDAAGVTEDDRRFYSDNYGIDEITGYDVGCLLYVSKTNFADIKPGDAVTFSIGGNTVVTHMVVAVDKQKKTVTTHGIANERNINEANISFSDIVGKASKFSIPFAGYVLDWAASASAKILSITFIIVYAVLLVTDSMLERAEKNDNEEEDKKTTDE